MRNHGAYLHEVSLVAACLVLFGSPPVECETLRVPSEYATIASAMVAAVGSDTVEIDCGTYHESGISMVSGVTLRSAAGDPSCVVIDGGGLDRVLSCTGVGSETRIEGITIRGGLTWSSIGFPGGGGMLCTAGSVPEITGCIFEGNEAPAGAGGGLACYQSSPKLLDCVFRENAATDAGGVYCKDTSASFERCSFVGNTSSEFGGGIRADGSVLTLSTCDFTGNSGQLAGGGLLLTLSSTAAITGCIFTENSGYRGGGIHVSYSFASISDTRFAENRAHDGEGWGEGGGLYCGDSFASPIVVGCSFERNEAGYGGGAMVRNLATPRLERCVFRDNGATSEGGALSVANDAAPVIAKCTFALNHSDYGGGALSTFNCSPILENCVLAFQTAGMVVDCLGIGYGGPLLSCCNVFGNAGGDWIGDCMDWQAGRNGNFSADPLFCDPEGGDLTLEAGSPCLPGHHPEGWDCGLIGALEEGCGPTATEPVTWGLLKGRFR